MNFTRVVRLAKLNAKLKRLPVVAKMEIRAALEKSADEIVAFAKRLVPVDTGRLRDSIGWTWGLPPGGSIQLAAASLGELTITIYAGDDEAFYARWMEFGTAKMKAQPFFYPSYRALRKRAKGRVSRAITKAAKKVANS